MNLVIELKPHGAEPSNYIDILIDEIKRLKLENYKFMSIDSKVIEELENYTWKKDKKTNEYINEPVDTYNHTIDAIRYALNNYIKETKTPKVYNKPIWF